MNVIRNQAPEIKTISNVHFPKPDEYTLDNGIKIHAFNLGSQDAVQVDLVFTVSRNEGRNPLVAKAVNELIGEASIHKTSGVLNEAIDFHGAFLESTYSVDHSSVSLFTLTKKLDDVLPLFEEVILEAVFPERELEIYLKNAKQKFMISQEKVATLSKRLYSQKLYGNHYYGSRTELNHFDEVTVEDLNNFYKNFYTQSNCNIIVSGKFDDSLILGLNRSFGKMTKGIKSNMDEKIIESKSEKHFQEKDGAIQSGVRVGKVLEVDFGTEEYFQLKVLNTVLGGYFGSRLMSNIREDKGYTYGIGSSVSYLKNACTFSIATEVGADVTHNTLKEIYFELGKICKELISSEELEIVKNYMLGSILKSSDGAFSLAQQYKGVYFMGEDLAFFERYINAISSVTSRQLQNVAQKFLLPETMLEAVVG